MKLFESYGALFRRRPKPNYEVSELAEILPRPGTTRPLLRVTVIRKRRWISTEALWIYSGLVYVLTIGKDGAPELHSRHFVHNLTEAHLRKIPGGDFGIMM